MNTTVWDFSNTGSTFHAFINGRTAACRSSIELPHQFKQNVTTLAKARQTAFARPGVAVCQHCTAKFTAAVHRHQASMAPSTGEGDYLPPAVEVTEVQDEVVIAEGTAEVYVKITSEVIEALRILRMNVQCDNELRPLFNILENAGIFSTIDEVADHQPAAECTCPPSYSANDYHGSDCPRAPERVSKCTCPPEIRRAPSVHLTGCPGDSAETRDCPANGCSLAYRVTADGTLTKHLNDKLEPCPGKAPLPKRVPAVRWGSYNHNEEN